MGGTSRIELWVCVGRGSVCAAAAHLPDPAALCKCGEGWDGMDKVRYRSGRHNGVVSLAVLRDGCRACRIGVACIR